MANIFNASFHTRATPYLCVVAALSMTAVISVAVNARVKTKGESRASKARRLSVESRQQQQAAQKKSIIGVLDTQVRAWNRGDIEEFMEGYARSPETLFVSGDTVTRGWQTVLERYRKNYDSPAKMGRLEFTELEIRVLSRDAAVALGRWQLTRAEDKPHGRFTLVFRRISSGQWRIVHDHTSSAAN